MDFHLFLKLVTYFRCIGEEVSAVHGGHCGHRCPYTWSPSASSLTLYRKHCPVVFNDYRVSGHEGHMTECARPSEDSGENSQQARANTELLVDENKCFHFISYDIEQVLQKEL